jgi:hypothetical protein
MEKLPASGCPGHRGVISNMDRPSQGPAPSANAYFDGKLAEAEQEQRRVYP